MIKIGAYKILYDKNLIVEYYNGIINAEDLIFLKNVIRNEPDYNLYSNTILDFRDCDLQIDYKGITKIIDFFKSKHVVNGSRKIAYLTSKPNQVAIATMYSQLAKESELGFNPNIFTTIEATAKLFGPAVITEKELIKIIDQLKTKPNNVYNK